MLPDVKQWHTLAVVDRDAQEDLDVEAYKNNGNTERENLIFDVLSSVQANESTQAPNADFSCATLWQATWP